MQWSITTPPTSLPLTWEQLKAHVRPASVNDEPYIMDLVASATQYAEEKMECSLMPQTITAVFDFNDVEGAHEWGAYNYSYANLPFPRRRGLWLPRGPIISITSLKDANNNAVAYIQRADGNRVYAIPTIPITPNMWPLTAVYQAGFSYVTTDGLSAAGVPADILNAIKVHVATTYLYREDVTNLAANAVHKLDEFYQFRGRGTNVH